MNHMRTAHTPGPWEVGPDMGYNFVVSPHGKSAIAICAHTHSYTPSDVEANARLIAAAPELLEACRGACLDLTDYASNPAIAKVIDNLRAKIAKATGGVK